MHSMAAVGIRTAVLLRTHDHVDLLSHVNVQMVADWVPPLELQQTLILQNLQKTCVGST